MGKYPAQNMVEYGILVAVIAILVLVGATTFGGTIGEWFRHLVGQITTNGT